MKLENVHLDQLDIDKFHHLGFSTSSKDVKNLFHDVKFVCLSGSTGRVKKFAKLVNSALELVNDDELVDLCSTDRYVMYKVGPVLIANHGMGVPSACIILHELFKLLHYAGATDVTFFRMGTCGGLGVEPGTVVLTKKAVDGMLLPKHTQLVLGEVKEYSTELKQTVLEEILQIVQTEDNRFQFDVQLGDTMCCDDFYEGQARLDGAFCTYSKQEKDEFFKKAFNSGVRNIEMESLVFASMCNRAGVKACIACVVLLNRLNDEDQIGLTKERLHEFEQRPGQIILEYIRRNIDQIKTNGSS